jgi:hypothetical protein
MEFDTKLINIMLKQQEEINRTIRNLPVERQVIEKGTHTGPISKPITSKTELFVDDRMVTLKRFIDCKLYKVEFATSVVTVGDLTSWFDLSDELFKRCSR